MQSICQSFTCYTQPLAAVAPVALLLLLLLLLWLALCAGCKLSLQTVWQLGTGCVVYNRLGIEMHSMPKCLQVSLSPSLSLSLSLSLSPSSSYSIFLWSVNFLTGQFYYVCGALCWRQLCHQLLSKLDH